MNQSSKPYQLFIGSLPSSFTPAVIKAFLNQALKGPYQLEQTKRKGKKKQARAVISVFSTADRDFLLNQKHFINNQEIRLQIYKTEDELKQLAKAVLRRRIYIKGLPVGATKEEIEREFEGFGKIETIFMKKNKQFVEGQMIQKKGVNEVLKCYVTFAEESSRAKCMDAQPMYFRGEPIELYLKTTTSQKNDKRFVVMADSRNDARKVNPQTPSDSFRIGTGNQHATRKSHFQQKFGSAQFFEEDLSSQRRYPSDFPNRARIRYPNSLRYAVEPFVQVQDNYSEDLFGFPVIEKLSLRRMMPIDRSTRRSKIIRFKNDLGEVVEDLGGYEHREANIRRNYQEGCRWR